MNIVLHVIGMIAAALLTWCFFLPPVNFVLVVAGVSLLAIISTLFAQFYYSW